MHIVKHPGYDKVLCRCDFCGNESTHTYHIWGDNHKVFNVCVKCKFELSKEFKLEEQE